MDNNVAPIVELSCAFPVIVWPLNVTLALMLIGPPIPIAVAKPHELPVFCVAVQFPPLIIDATWVFEELQVSSEAGNTAVVAPLALVKVPSATYCWVEPTVSVDVAGLTLIAVNAPPEIVNTVEALT